MLDGFPKGTKPVLTVIMTTSVTARHLAFVRHSDALRASFVRT